MTPLPCDQIDERAWVRQIADRDRSLIHHALRMLATHPMTTEQKEISSLADAFWNETCRRVEEEKASDDD